MANETILFLVSNEKVSVMSMKADITDIKRHLSNMPRKAVYQSQIIEVE